MSRFPACVSAGSNKKAIWTEEEVEELRKLYEEHRDSEGLHSLIFFSCTSFESLIMCIKVLLYLPVVQILSLNIDFYHLVPDIVETLLPLLRNRNRTRRQVVIQMVSMGLVESAKELKKPK